MAMAAELHERRKADSEPVAWLWSRDDERDVSLTPPDDDDDAADAIECGWTATPLYRHAQPAPVVNYVLLADSQYDLPYSMPSNLREFIDQEIGILFSDDDAQGVWIACRRAAMLAAAPQPQNAPQNIPEIITGWISVSERMPEYGDYLVTDGRDFDVQLFDGEQFIPGFVWEDKITHWMPLPAAPQEVSHG
ncbi:DUF551 domain-containing protein [Klebsiella oxytoca]|nr:DUF551 domain-containing protein [Klebsiella oxytoca]